MGKTLLLIAVSLSTSACNMIAPFDFADQPEPPDASSPDTNDADSDDGNVVYDENHDEYDGEDFDDPSPDVTSEDSAPTCTPSCGDRECGPDGCGGICATCDDQVCAACPPGDVCDLTYQCVEPGPELWVFVAAKDQTFVQGTKNRSVSFTRNFVILSTEMSQETLRAAASGRNPSHFTDGNEIKEGYPAENLTWNEAAMAVNFLSASDGLDECYICEGDCILRPPIERLGTGFESPYECDGYRLPTEAEWEFAARALTTDSTYNGEIDVDLPCEDNLSEIAWYSCNSEETTQPIGLKQPNVFFLYDMLGNVAEWCHDYYEDEVGTEAVIDPFGPETGFERVYRGGTFEEETELQVVTTRRRDGPDTRAFIGLRPVRSVR